jgi:hypothetical protein
MAAAEPDLAWAVEALAAGDGAAAARTRAALAGWRRALEADGGGWGWSRLTGDGFPLEAVWRSGARAGWTCEVGGPGLDPRARLARAARLAGADAAVEDALAEVQRAGPVSWGAWLGARTAGAAALEHKLYVEVPAGGERAAWRLLAGALGSEPVLTTRAPQLRLIGHRPAEGAWEAYVLVERLATWELARIADRAGLRDAAAILCDTIAGVLERSFEEQLPGSQHGVSLASAGGRPVLTVFVYARALGGDARIRKRLAAQVAARGWEVDGYRRLTAGATRDDARTDHGLLGFSIDGRGEVGLAVGVRPRAPGGGR